MDNAVNVRAPGAPAAAGVPGAIRNLTALHRLGLGVGEYQLAGTQPGLRVTWLPVEEFRPDQTQQYVTLKLAPTTAEALQVCLPEGLFQALLQGIDPVQFWQLDEALRCACLQVRNNGVLAWLNQRWQCHVRVDGVDLPGRPLHQDQALVFVLHTAGGLAYPPALLLPTGALTPDSLAALYEADGSARTVAAGQVPLSVEVISGQTRVSVSELRELRVNDIILPEAGEYSLTEVRLRLGDQPLFAAEVQGDSIQVKQLLRADYMANTETSDAPTPTNEALEAATEGAPETTAEGTPETTAEGTPETTAEGTPETAAEGTPETAAEGTPETAAEGTPEAAGGAAPGSRAEETAAAPPRDDDPARLSPEDVEVTLHFSLGSLTRTLAEINDITEHDLLELPRHVDNGVDILVNGKRFASGEPVRIGDRVGIRVVRVHHG